MNYIKITNRSLTNIYNKNKLYFMIYEIILNISITRNNF